MTWMENVFDKYSDDFISKQKTTYRRPERQLKT